MDEVKYKLTLLYLYVLIRCFNIWEDMQDQFKTIYSWKPCKNRVANPSSLTLTEKQMVVILQKLQF